MIRSARYCNYSRITGLVHALRGRMGGMIARGPGGPLASRATRRTSPRTARCGRTLHGPRRRDAPYVLFRTGAMQDHRAYGLPGNYCFYELR
jgi:ribosomal protein L34E